MWWVSSKVVDGDNDSPRLTKVADYALGD
jgi:hypothetical protein